MGNPALCPNNQALSWHDAESSPQEQEETENAVNLHGLKIRGLLQCNMLGLLSFGPKFVHAEDVE